MTNGFHPLFFFLWPQKIPVFPSSGLWSGCSNVGFPGVQGDSGKSVRTHFSIGEKKHTSFQTMRGFKSELFSSKN